MYRPTGHNQPGGQPQRLAGYPEAVATLGVELQLPRSGQDDQLIGVLLRTAGPFLKGIDTPHELRRRLADDLSRMMSAPAANSLTRKERRARDELRGWVLPQGVAHWGEVADRIRTNGHGGFYDRVALYQASVTFGLRFKVIQNSLPEDFGPIDGHLFVFAKVPVKSAAGGPTDLWIPTRPVRPGAGLWLPGAGHGLAGSAGGEQQPASSTQVYRPSVQVGPPVGGTHNEYLQRQRRLAVVAAAQDLAGKLRWRGAIGPEPKAGWRPSETTKERHPNDMAIWLHRDNATEPAENSIMNCWDAILFSACRAGIVDKGWLQQVYEYPANVAINANSYHRRHDRVDDTYEYPQVKDRFGRKWYRPMAEYYGALMATLYSGPLQRYVIDPATGVGGADIPAGYLVFFGWPEHVAMSTGARDDQGRQLIFSSWVHPQSIPDANPVWNKSIGFMQQTTIEEL